jgi:hypothetical protein
MIDRGILEKFFKIKFRNNLFRIFIEPWYRLGFQILRYANRANSNYINIEVRWKLFYNVSMTTSNKIVNKIMRVTIKNLY